MIGRLAIAAAGLALAGATTPAGATGQAAQIQPQAQRSAAAPPASAASGAGADAVFKAWDADHNGVLSQAEFRRAWEGIRERAEAKVESRLREQFDKVDANGNGAVDAGEYGNLLLVKRAGKSAPPLSAFDGNGDQRLQFEEYLALIGRMASMQRPQGKTP